MQAAQLHGYHQPFSVGSVPDPSPGPGEVLIRVAGSGACHSDLHVRDGAFDGLAWPAFPWILGHENAGYVAALGPGATGVEVGEPVCVYGGWGCGTCRLCLTGDEHLCDLMRWGGMGVDGGYAELLVVPSTRHLVRLGDELDPVLAAPLTDAGLTPYRAVKKALPHLIPGTTAVTIGVGGLGQFALQFLELMSPSRVVALDIDAAKRAKALELGAEVALDPSDPDIGAQLRSHTGADGAAVVLDFVGATSTLAVASEVVGPRGLIVLVGLAGGQLDFSYLGLGAEARVTSSRWGNRAELDEVIALARQGLLTIDVERHPLSDINAVFERLEHGGVTGRAVLVP